MPNNNRIYTKLTYMAYLTYLTYLVPGQQSTCCTDQAKREFKFTENFNRGMPYLPIQYLHVKKLLQKFCGTNSIGSPDF